MLDIPEVIKELFKQDGIRKNFRVHFPNGERADLVNKDIIEESVKFTESTCSQQTLRFGLTEASVIEFECVGVENIAGMTIECGIEIDVSSLSREDRLAYGTRTDDVEFPFYAVPYGVFVVDKCPRQADMKRRKVTAYTRVSKDFNFSIGLSDNNEELRFRARDFIKASGFLKNSMPAFAWEPLDLIYGGRDNTGGAVSLYGVTIARASIESSTFYPPQDYGTDWAVAVYIEAKPDQYDGLEIDLFNLAMNACPLDNNKYIYSATATPGQDRCFLNTKQGYAIFTGCFRPCCYLRISGRNGTRYSAPKFLDINKITLIDLRDMLTPIYGDTSSIAAYNWDLIVSVPIKWKKNARWEGYDTIQNWPIQEDHERGGQTKIRFYRILPTEGDFDVIISSTGSETLPVLGAYKTYYDVIEGDELLTSLFEMIGEMGNQKRGGELDGDVLRKESPYLITQNEQRTAWFEEAETPRIGSVIYPYIENNETQEGLLMIDSGYTGTYDLSKNKLISHLQNKTSADMAEFLRSFFVPNTREAYYVPIDLTMTGLPFLEDGDAIQIETPDGEVIDSYILRRTISGVQHLVDDIEAQGEVG